MAFLSCRCANVNSTVSLFKKLNLVGSRLSRSKFGEFKENFGRLVKVYSYDDWKNKVQSEQKGQERSIEGPPRSNEAFICFSGPATHFFLSTI